MKKLVCFLVALFCLSSVVYAQKPSAQRLKEYEKLEQQRQQCLAWPKEHLFATRWGQDRKRDEAEQIRRQQYTQFRDVELWRVQDAQRFIEEAMADLKGAAVPYVKTNLFPQENLDQMAKDQPKLLKELLLAYPENMARVDANVLLDLLSQDEALAAYFANYVVYLRSYVRYPDCVQQMRQYYKERFKWTTNKEAEIIVMDILADGCQDYALRQDQKTVVEHNLTAALRQSK